MKANVTQLAKVPRRKPCIKKIPVHDLVIDQGLQRWFIPGHAKEIGDNLDLDALGVLTISERKDGTYVVIDGQHRVSAVMSNELGEWEINCYVYRGLSFEQEIALVRRLNRTRRMLPLDNFQKAVLERHPDFLAMDRIIRDAGLSVATGPGPHLQCVSAVEDVYKIVGAGREPGDVLRAVLSVATSAWGADNTSVDGAIVRGLGMLLDRYWNKLDTERLVLKLAKFGGGGPGLRGKAKVKKEMDGGTVSRNIARIAVSVYNKGTRGKSSVDPFP